MSQPKTIYRITTFFRKRPDLTEDQFYDHWGNVHGPLVIPWALKHGVLEYTQYQTPAELRALVTAGMDPAFAGGLDFNAAADWYVESYERYLAAYNDPYYRQVIEPDEAKFVDKGQTGGEKQEIVRAVTTLGYCRSMIKGGEASKEVPREIWEHFSQISGEKKEF